MTFYEFLKDNTQSNDIQLSSYANALLGFIDTMPKFPKANSDRKTVENSLRKAMDGAFDAYMFEYIWKAYEIDKILL